MKRGRMHAVRNATAIAVTAWMLASGASAQFRMKLGAVDLSDYPSIHIPLQVFDNSAMITVLDASQFTVTQNGLPMSPLELDCQREVVDSVMNFLFVLDVSLSMGFIEGTRIYDVDSVKWRTAKSTLDSAFQKLRAKDNAALFSFAHTPILEAPYTTDRTVLHDAVYGLALREGTSIFDAVIAGVRFPRPPAGKSVLILITDGSDQTSTFSISDAISAAVAANVAIYTIGLGVEPQDVGVLERLASETGGEAFIAPTAAQLADVLDRIINSLINNSCILTYTTPDTCRRGGVRNVTVNVTIGTTTLTEQTSYTVQDFTPHVAVSLGHALTTDDDTDLRVPVIVSGPVHAGEPMDFSFSVRDADGLLVFDSVETAGSVLDGQSIAVSGGTGTYILAANGSIPEREVPPGSTDALFYLLYHVPHYTEIRSGRMELSVASLHQACPTVVTSSGFDLTVVGCPDELSLAIAPLFITDPGSEFLLPIDFRDSIDVAQDLTISFTVHFDTTYLRYLGFTSENTITGTLQPIVRESASGTITVAAGPGRSVAATGVVVYLRFISTASNRPFRTDLSISDAEVKQSCSPPVHVTNAPVVVNGICDRTIVRTGLTLAQNRPNPFSLRDGGTTVIHFELVRDGYTRVEVRDLAGRLVRLLVDGNLVAGPHEYTFDARNLPAGSYVFSVRCGADIQTRRLIWTR